MAQSKVFTVPQYLPTTIHSFKIHYYDFSAKSPGCQLFPKELKAFSSIKYYWITYTTMLNSFYDDFSNFHLNRVKFYFHYQADYSVKNFRKSVTTYLLFLVVWLFYLLCLVCVASNSLIRLNDWWNVSIMILIFKNSPST